jgi:hypothetical protein
VKTLMRRMGIEALYRRPRTTKPEPGHKIYPYLLRGVEITRPNQVWAMDITYIPMARGFVYLAVVLDWFSRRVLSWRVSITMEAAFCVEALGGSAERATALCGFARTTDKCAWPRCTERCRRHFVKNGTSVLCSDPILPCQRPVFLTPASRFMWSI